MSQTALARTGRALVVRELAAEFGVTEAAK
jgi:hypothetical protein